MDLDNLQNYSQFDPTHFWELIHEQPEQLERAWTQGERIRFAPGKKITRVLFCGVESGQIAGEMIKNIIEPNSKLLFHVLSSFEIPSWARNQETLLIIVGFTGNEPELVDLYFRGMEFECQTFTLATGGKLISNAMEIGSAYFKYEFTGPARTALGWMVGLPMALLTSASLIESPKDEILSTVSILKETRNYLSLETPVTGNPAKRLAGQFVDRLVFLFASEKMLPAALRWKSQINLNAKAWAQVECISETRNVTVNGLIFPVDKLGQSMSIFFHCSHDHSKDDKSLASARQFFMVEGLGTDIYQPAQKSLMCEILAAIQFGDYVSYFLAIAYGVNPLLTPGVEEIHSMIY